VKTDQEGFMKTVINEKQRGFLFRNGKFIKMLQAGKYRNLKFIDGKEIEVAELGEAISERMVSLDVLLRDEAINQSTKVVEIADGELALHFVNNKYAGYLGAGRYAFWTVYDRHDFTIVDIKSPEVSNDIPHYILKSLPANMIAKIEVVEYEKARLFFDKKFARILDAGMYYFWKSNVTVDVGIVDTRLTRLELTGQDILTLDKVNVRINFVCNYRITDYVKVLTEVDDYVEHLHVAAQLALREYIGQFRIDEILENKNRISEYVLEKLIAAARVVFVDVIDAGVKDIILPGEIKDIMNTVLVAEKRAQANVIMRREEVASTRSLLNTAKLMDENHTLYKLKELEYLEKICENVGNISVSGGDLLTQLREIIKVG
jgi:hypothetical protein